MARAQRKTSTPALHAVPTPSPEAAPAPRAKLREADPTAHAAAASPVHEQFDALANAFGPAPQLPERKYPGYIRAAIILGGSAALWAGILTAGGRLLALAH